MAGDIVSFTVQTLGNLLAEETRFLSGVRGQVTQLQAELKRLKCFLKDVETEEFDSEAVRNWRSEIREAAYDAEDCLETFRLKQESNSRRKKGNFKAIVRRFVCLLNECATLHKTGSEIEEITTRVSKITTSMKDLGVREILDREDSVSVQARKWEKRQSFGSAAERNLVGLEKTVEKLVRELVNGSEKKENFRGVSIIGMGGLGKTTLAKQMFHHETARRHFDRFAWVYVSRDCKQRYVWQEMVLNLSSKGDKQKIMDMSDQELHRKLYGLLQNKKCLVVFDDIWSIDAWDRIAPVFPYETGSKIILTSRVKDVALHADPRGIIHEPNYLSHEESWELLQKVALSDPGFMEPMVYAKMEELGRQIVKKCGGLPLAITVVGGVLATKHTVKEWQTVHEQTKSVINAEGGSSRRQSNSAILEVLALSYLDLPPHLKQCFLYFAHFPQGYQIPSGKMRSYWAAEGMVVPDHVGDDMTVEDVADMYMEELIRRSMVVEDSMSVELAYFRACSMHDMMSEVCQKKAEEENFVRMINLQHNLNDNEFFSSRRLGVYLGDLDLDFDKASLFIGSSNSRSLLLLKKIQNSKWVASGLIPFKNLRLLRVLEFSGVHLQQGKLPESIGYLIHLKYFCLRSSNVTQLPSSLGNLTLMQNLDLFADGPVYIPNVLRRMHRLRHLFLPRTLDPRTKLSLGELTSLQTLWDFHVGNCSPGDLLHMTTLKRLSVSFSSEIIDFQEIIRLSNVLKLLQGLTVKFRSEHLEVPPYPPVDITQIMSAFVSLNELELFIKITRLPKPDMFPRFVNFLRLSRCELEQDPFSVLEKLPFLRNLQLFRNAYIGTKLVCSKNGFPQLHSLSIITEDNVEEWIVEQGAMPCLAYLEVRGCRKLEMLPDGLRFVGTLRELEIRDMSKMFTDKLVPGGEDFYKIQHVPSVIV